MQIVPTALIVNILVFVLDKAGIHVGSAALTTTIETLVLLGSSLVAWVHHREVKNELKGLKGIRASRE